MAQAAPKQHPYHPPVVCYAVENLPQIDTQLLQRLAEGSHELVREFEIPPRDGRVSGRGVGPGGGGGLGKEGRHAH